MAPYSHHINTHQKSRRAWKLKRISQAVVGVFILITGYIGIDWLITNIRSNETVVSLESSATVQSAKINIFQSPYFRFQADENWREVTDDRSLVSTGSMHQYLYRRFNKNFIEHEIYIAVNLDDDSKLARHNIPTRVMPIRVESDDSLTQLNDVSEPCVEALPPGDENLQPHTIVQNDVEYYCFPNENNAYVVTVGSLGGTNKLKGVTESGEEFTITIIYRNITATPEPQIFERIIRNFKLT